MISKAKYFQQKTLNKPVSEPESVPTVFGTSKSRKEWAKIHQSKLYRACFDKIGKVGFFEKQR